MRYFTFHIDDSGAIEYCENKNVRGVKTMVCKLYNDREFNKLNDVLHSTYDFIINTVALNVLSNSNIIPYDVNRVIVTKKKLALGVFPVNGSNNYFQLKLNEPIDLICYDWIDFSKSEIFAVKVDSKDSRQKIYSHIETLSLIEQNKKYNQSEGFVASKIEAKKIVFNDKFDNSIDLFRIPLYSFGTYVSEVLKAIIESHQLTDVSFANSVEEIGEVWKSDFPAVEFS